MKASRSILPAILIVSLAAVAPVTADQENVSNKHSAGTGLQVTETRPGFQRASAVVGSRVSSLEGEELGTVNDLVFSNNGDLEYIILARNGLPGRSEKLIPIPFSIVQTSFTFENDTLIVPLNSEKIQNAPTIDQNELADLQDPKWGEKVHSFFGTSGERIPKAVPFVPEAAPDSGTDGETGQGR